MRWTGYGVRPKWECTVQHVVNMHILLLSILRSGVSHLNMCVSCVQTTPGLPGCVRGRISSLELVTRSLLFRFPFYSSCQFWITATENRHWGVSPLWSWLCQFFHSSFTGSPTVNGLRTLFSGCFCFRSSLSSPSQSVPADGSSYGTEVRLMGR